MCTLLLTWLLTSAGPPRLEMDLGGTWRVWVTDAAAARPIRVPGAFEEVLGSDFDGRVTYERTVTVPAGFEGRKVMVAFAAVATHAIVRWDGEEIGRHLGGWTSFRCEVPAERVAGEHVLQVEVDERVGHDTQGFLPICAPHFGGIWQGVRLLGLPHSHFDDRDVLVFGDGARKTLVVEAPVRGWSAEQWLEISVGDRPTVTVALGSGRVEIPVPDCELWTLENPRLYDVTLRLMGPGGLVDQLQRRTGFRSWEAKDRVCHLNGTPVNVRGVLEWGYHGSYPAPHFSREDFLRDVVAWKARGFNLVKFCLWVPPEDLLEILDEQGLLAWIEYPLWHPRFAPESRSELLSEFDEFFAHDRSHPSVVIRSLTCETGPSAPLEVIQALYDQAKSRIPQAFVEDDSSWIAWNRVHDFYDDHPYGNNNTWLAVLDRLDTFITERKPMPLLLGEAITADTWLPLERFAGTSEARALPIGLAAQHEFEDVLGRRYGADTPRRLTADSLRWARHQRKDQIEELRQRLPDAGYVVSVARDFPKASMGLASAFGEQKWLASDWSWHGDTLLALSSGQPRSVVGGQPIRFQPCLVHHGPTSLPAGAVHLRWGSYAVAELSHPEVRCGERVLVESYVGSAPVVTEPTPLTLSLRAGPAGREASNDYTIWVLPPRPVGLLPDDVPVVDRLTPELFASVEGGGQAVLEATNESGSWVSPTIWLLRGAPWFPPHPVTDDLPPEMWLDLGVHEWHPRGLLPLGDIWDEVDPIVGYWDTHDHDGVNRWAMAYETRIGAGRLLVCSVPLTGSPAADALRRCLVEHVRRGPSPAAGFSPERVQALRSRLSAVNLSLTDRPWEFLPEGASEAVAIHVGRSWESQGFPRLDGVATYRLALDLPDDWVGKPLYMNFEGVDDAYWVSFDGQPCGSGGDPETRRTAFDERSSHRLTPSLVAGAHVIEVKVLDWYGAGGIHRPVVLSTAPMDSLASILVP